MHAIEFFLGSKYGGWIRSSERHATANAAQTAIREQVASERRADMTPILRRTIPA